MLMEACRTDSRERVRQLCKVADLAQRNAVDATALDMAFALGNTEIVEELRGHGAADGQRAGPRLRLEGCAGG